MSEEQQEEVKTYTQAEVDELVSGLKSNNEKLLSEKKATQAREAEAAEAARLAQEEAARKSGDVEAIEKTLSDRHKSELEKLTTELNKRDSIILGERNAAAINEMASIFTDSSREIGKSLLQGMVTTEYNEDGKPFTKYTDNSGNVTTDLATFKQVISANDGLKPLLKGVQMTGGGATGSGSNNAEAANSLELKIEKAKEAALKTGSMVEYLELSQQRK